MTIEAMPGFIVGEDPEPELLDETLWAREAIRDSLKTLGEGLQRMVTLCTALLAGSAAFFGQIPTHPAIKCLAVVCFMVGLGASLWGVMPFTKQLNPTYPEQVRKIRQAAVTGRRKCIWFAAGGVFMGFAVLTLGMLLAPQSPQVVPVLVYPSAPPAGQVR